MPSKTVDLFVGIYKSVEDADLDFEAVKALHAAKQIGTYDAIVLAKDEDGKVVVHQHEKPSHRGAWKGLVVGGVVGIIFPPSILVTGAIGAAAGGIVGRLKAGLPKQELDELAEKLTSGEAAVLVVTKERTDGEIEGTLSHATDQLHKVINADRHALQAEVDQGFDEATKA